jgi:hypothetical protein
VKKYINGLIFISLFMYVLYLWSGTRHLALGKIIPGESILKPIILIHAFVDWWKQTITPGNWGKNQRAFLMSYQCLKVSYLSFPTIQVGTNSETCTVIISFITCVGHSPGSSTDPERLPSSEETFSSLKAISYYGLELWSTVRWLNRLRHLN